MARNCCVTKTRSTQTAWVRMELVHGHPDTRSTRAETRERTDLISNSDPASVSQWAAGHVRSLPVPTADTTKPTNVLFRGGHPQEEWNETGRRRITKRNNGRKRETDERSNTSKGERRERKAHTHAQRLVRWNLYVDSACVRENTLACK